MLLGLEYSDYLVTNIYCTTHFSASEKKRKTYVKHRNTENYKEASAIIYTFFQYLVCSSFAFITAFILFGGLAFSFFKKKPTEMFFSLQSSALAVGCIDRKSVV